VGHRHRIECSIWKSDDSQLALVRLYVERLRRLFDRSRADVYPDDTLPTERAHQVEVATRAAPHIEKSTLRDPRVQ
jgi:hypothetical protein